jgi:hypothetical protein
METPEKGITRVRSHSFSNRRSGHCFLGNILIAVFLILLVLGCDSRTPQEETLVRTQSMQSLYPEALRLAQEWKTDAYLVRAETDFTLDDDSRDLYYNFVFRSRSSPFMAMLLSYDSTRGSLREKLLPVPTNNTGRDLEILDTDWSIDSVEALQVAQAHGGSEFLTKHSSSNLSLLLRLEKRLEGEQSKTVWLVSYYDQFAIEVLRVVVDASTGGVVEVDIGQ